VEEVNEELFKACGGNNKHFQMPKTLVKILLDKGGFPKK
jgi:hypothetical protein